MSPTIQALMLGGAFLAWCAVFYKSASLWRARANPASWAYWVGFLALALNLTLLTPSINAWLDRTTGIVALTYLLCDAAALLTCWSWLVCLYHLSPPDPRTAATVRWFGALVALALAFFGLRFAIAPGLVQHRLSADTAGIYLAAYRLVFVGLIAAHMAFFIVLLRRYIAEVQHPILIVRLRCMMLAAGLMLGFSVNESLRIVLVPSPEIIGAIFLLTAIAAMVVGLTLSRPLERGLELLREYGVYLRLYPLWRALYPVDPGLSFLAAPSLRRRLVPGDELAFVICRQAIEIRDWQLALRPFHQAGDQDTAKAARHEANLDAPSTDRGAVVEAAQLVAALRVWTAHTAGNVRGAGTAPPPPSFRDPDLPTALDWRREARYLTRVARHFTRLANHELGEKAEGSSSPRQRVR